ncbi:hypothetical protein ACFQZT_31205 [Paenibacillus sp. GCM10027628]|uniref:hypothetical protein n=1 Tax=Paenibacillus sp. GCM10027628 TaxID=3273413 RepID=UPI0036376D67
MGKSKIFKVIGSLILCSALVPISASATTWTGGRTSGIFTAYYDSSVSQYGYTSIFDEGKNNWGGISSKVAITYTSSNTSTSDEYYAGYSSIVGRLGYTQPYKTDSLGLHQMASTSETWTYCVVSLYDNNIKASKNGSNPDGSLTRAQIVSSVTTHEIGHSLSLAHSPTGTASVMTANDITNFPPNTYDKTDLKSKWGN